MLINVDFHHLGVKPKKALDTKRVRSDLWFKSMLTGKKELDQFGLCRQNSTNLNQRVTGVDTLSQ